MTAPKSENTSPAGEGDFNIPDDSTGFRLAEAAVWFLLEKKAEDIVILDLRGVSDVCDFFVIASGASDVQVKALGRHLRRKLDGMGHDPAHVEGQDTGTWVLLDYFDVVVHVFHEDTRQYYQLERLWDDARRLDLGPDWFGDPAVAARHPDLEFTLAPGAETQGS